LSPTPDFHGRRDSWTTLPGLGFFARLVVDEYDFRRDNETNIVQTQLKQRPMRGCGKWLSTSARFELVAAVGNSVYRCPAHTRP